MTSSKSASSISASAARFDYTRKDGVEHTEILAPEPALPWVYDRTALWNAVGQAEKCALASIAVAWWYLPSSTEIAGPSPAA